MSLADKKWEDVQKKAFTHWVNTCLAKRNESIEGLETGFNSGVKLISLVEILSGKNITTKWSPNPKLKVHKITNCYIALKFLTDECHVAGLTISAEDIVNGDRLSLILGFCWMLLRKFQEPAPVKGAKGNSFEANLLQWCKDVLHGYSDIKLDSGFKSEAWFNGKALLGLINEYDGGVLDYKSYDAKNNLVNVNAALDLAEKHINLPQIMEAQELADGKIQEKNLVLYLSLMYNAFKERSAGDSRESLLKKIKELEERIKEVTAENEALRKARADLEHRQHDLNEKLVVVSSEKTTLLTSTQELQSELSSLQEANKKEIADLKAQVEELEKNIKLLNSSAGDSAAQLKSAKDELQKERDAIKEELKKMKAQLEKEKEALAKQNEELLSNIKKTQKSREELENTINKRQEDHSRALHSLRRHLLQNVHDMHVWKVFLEQDRDYESEDLHIIMEPELESIKFSEQVSTLDTAISEENGKLDQLTKEVESEFKQVKAERAAAKKTSGSRK